MEAERIPRRSRRPHALLRGKMAELDITGQYLARKLAIDPQTVSNKMMGYGPWTEDEMRGIMDILGIPEERMHEYFPDYRRLRKKRP